VLSILVVDDEDRARTILIMLLEEHGYMVTGVSTATEALNRINEEVHDLIIRAGWMY